jgi:hypothetical protein
LNPNRLHRSSSNKNRADNFVRRKVYNHWPRIPNTYPGSSRPHFRPKNATKPAKRSESAAGSKRRLVHRAGGRGADDLPPLWGHCEHHRLPLPAYADFIASGDLPHGAVAAEFAECIMGKLPGSIRKYAACSHCRTIEFTLGKSVSEEGIARRGRVVRGNVARLQKCVQQLRQRQARPWLGPGAFEN